MAKNHDIRIAVTKDQKERIINNAKINGYSTISAYLRNIALNHNLIFEIYDMLKKKEK